MSFPAPQRAPCCAWPSLSYYGWWSEMTAEQKRLQRLHILATIAQYGPMTGLELVKAANEECCDERLPDLTNRGIGQKLNALSLRGLVHGKYDGVARLFLWDITVRGRTALGANGVEI